MLDIDGQLEQYKKSELKIFAANFKVNVNTGHSKAEMIALLTPAMLLQKKKAFTDMKQRLKRLWNMDMNNLIAHLETVDGVAFNAKTRA